MSCFSNASNSKNPDRNAKTNTIFRGWVLLTKEKPGQRELSYTQIVSKYIYFKYIYKRYKVLRHAQQLPQAEFIDSVCISFFL